LPLKVFEISDVCLIDDSDESGAVNKRRLCFAYQNLSSGLEVFIKINFVFSKRIT